MMMVFQQAEEELARLRATDIELEDRLSNLNITVQDVRDVVAALSSLIASQEIRIRALEDGSEPVPPPDEEESPVSLSRGMWITAEALQALPMEGPEWESLKKAADNAPDAPSIIADQNDKGDLSILAVALVAARTGLDSYRDKALSMLNQTIAIPYWTDSRMNLLELGRNGLSLIIAADVLGIHEGPIYDFLKGFLRGVEDGHHGDRLTSLEQAAFESGSNSSSQLGAVFTALAIYLNDKALLDKAWEKFKRFAGDRTSSATISFNQFNDFEVDESNPVGIQNKAAVKGGYNVDGAVGNDLGREGLTPARTDPNNYLTTYWTYYGSTGAEGWVPAAVMLHQQGYPALEVEDQAVKRAYLYWKYLSSQTGDARWDDPARAEEIRHLLKWAYPDLDIQISYPTDYGRTVGWTGWTHPIKEG